ncbi:transcriptional regulator protein Pur-beta-like isoform X2 [Convolutriloba macropyga]|uniref:transcriptional regulator protein Pur-beta-like isoform X2 n=1 Tax=Convolutriloba macropyga TaxID=536237 RepID=UPI003F5213C0
MAYAGARRGEQSGLEHGSVRELASLSLNIQSKKFYLDVKENMSGRFVKIAEINVSGIKNKVIFDMTSTKLLLDHLVSFADFYVSLGPQPLSGQTSGATSEQQLQQTSSSHLIDPSSRPNAPSSGDVTISAAHASQSQQQFAAPSGTLGAPAAAGGGGSGSRPLKSESFKRLSFNRIYHMDLAQNDKGVFLKLSCANQSGGRQGKQTVVVPAQGIVELRDKLKLLVDEFYIEEVEESLPQSKKFAYDSRLLFMDVGHSNKGFYIKLSEISKNPAANYKRQTIQIPRKLWLDVRDALDELFKETEASAAAAEQQFQHISLEEELAMAEQQSQESSQEQQQPSGSSSDQASRRS